MQGHMISTLQRDTKPTKTLVDRNFHLNILEGVLNNHSALSHSTV
jgi:hypothetical protein